MESCLDCSWFAGRERDRQATLFRMGKGYCNHVDHHGGVWNVVQDITSERGCTLFEAAPERIAVLRRQAAEKLMKEGRSGKKPKNQGRRW